MMCCLCETEKARQKIPFELTYAYMPDSYLGNSQELFLMRNAF